MGILNDFIGAIQDISTLADDARGEILGGRRYSSVSRRSMEGIMQFPVIVSRSIDLETLQMVTKALEKQFASFLQTAITMSPALNLAREKDAIGYLRKFHQNSNVRTNIMDDTINALASFESALMESAYNVYGSDEVKNIVVVTTCEGSISTVVHANKKGLVHAMEGIREDILNDKFIPGGTKYRFVNENNRKLFPVSEAGKPNNNTQRRSTRPNIFADKSDHRQDHRDYSDRRTQTDARNANMSTRVDGDIHNEYGDVHYHVKGNIDGIGGANKNVMLDFKLPNNVLVDNDVKKANELVPTSMHVRVILMDSDGRPGGNMDFIAGVKATMHPVPTDEMVNNITKSLKGGGKLFKTIRWTTGEIAFVRDYLLNLTEIKDDATRETRGESRWWTALKHRRKLAKIKKAIFLSGDLLPNASIVMSIEEVEFIKSQHGIDILNPKVAYKLMREYYLISLVVVDSGRGTVHFLFDGTTDYQEVTFTGLERGDIAGRGVDFKDVMKLVQRV